MAYHKKLTAIEIRANLQRRIDEDTAENNALKNVKIDTKHKTLTNRAIAGDGARIGDYLGINKALFVSYTVEHKDGSKRYESRQITAYSYENLDGTEIGTNGMMRISRTITPAELAKLVNEIVEAKTENIKNLKSEYRRADSIAKKQNALVDQINKFNAGVSYASEAQI